MPTTPLLGLPQVSGSQNNKEITINDAILGLENAVSRRLVVSLASGSPVTLSEGQATSNFIYIATAASGASTLRFPNQIGGVNMDRAFCVRNTSGAALTVQFVSGAGAAVEIPDGQSRLILAIDGADMVAVTGA